MAQEQGLRIETELSRDLGLTSALAIGIGTMIAAGIFTLSGLAIRNVGSAAVVAFLLAAVVALFTALTYCEFASIYPQSGEGYLYARKTFPLPLAYLVGWTLFLGYTSSCAFYIASFSSYFAEFIWAFPLESLSGAVMLVLLTLLNIKGTKESGTFQIVVTIAKVVLLLWFVLGGLGSVAYSEIVDRFSTDIAKIGSTATLVFITFFGFSAIAASAGEVINPVKNIPRAIFISVGVVTLLYTLVVLVTIAANLSEYSESAMGVAARGFLGPIGGMVIVAGALFSMVSASNASIMAGSRVTMSMSWLGHFPKVFGSIHPKTQTPVPSLLIVGGAILLFAVSLRLEDLAHFADTLLLVALILVNAALIVHRRKFPGLERPFRVPLVPLVPALGIVANLYLLSQSIHHPVPAMLAGGALVLGFSAFLLWKGLQAGEVAIPGRQSRVALERSAAGGKSRYRVLVPLANPANVPRLMELAAAIASQRNGDIVALRVALVPEQIPPTREEAYVTRERQILEQAHTEAQKYEIPITSLVRVGHHAARAILETARERDCNVILMGWKGYTSTAQRILGEVVDNVVRHARCDIILAKMVGDAPLRHILLPTAGGAHARRAENYAASIVRFQGESLTLCSIASPKATEAELAEIEQRLEEAANRVAEEGPIHLERKLVRHSSVTVGLIRESKNYDAMIIGATGRGIYPQILFGNVPEMIAKRSDKTVLLVKYHHPVKALLGRVFTE